MRKTKGGKTAGPCMTSPDCGTRRNTDARIKCGRNGRVPELQKVIWRNRTDRRRVHGEAERERSTRQGACWLRAKEPVGVNNDLPIADQDDDDA
jgi:hypothetical protein